MTSTIGTTLATSAAYQNVRGGKAIEIIRNVSVNGSIAKVEIEIHTTFGLVTETSTFFANVPALEVNQ